MSARLALEEQLQGLRDALVPGLIGLGAGVRSVFAPQLAEQSPRNRDQLTDLLVVATDAYAWSLLRRDRGLRPSAVERRIRLMVQALLSSQEN